jgi:hypothetical protein
MGRGREVAATCCHNLAGPRTHHVMASYKTALGTGAKHMFYSTGLFTRNTATSCVSVSHCFAGLTFAALIRVWQLRVDHTPAAADAEPDWLSCCELALSFCSMLLL